MRRITFLVALCLSAVLPAAAEEISLKDGTKIVGRMSGITSDKIEVETSYGKIQVKRSDILTISFPENKGDAPGVSETTPAKMDAPKVDEALNGIQYVNRTGKFTLNVPPDWVIAGEMRHSPDTLAALSSRDKMRYLMVIQEEYPGSLESYKELNLLNARRTLTNVEILAESPGTIDGKTALTVFYRGNLQKSSNLPVEFVTAFIQSGKSFTKITVWCVEPLFHDMQPAFEKILGSYHSTAGQATAGVNRP